MATTDRGIGAFEVAWDRLAVITIVIVSPGSLQQERFRRERSFASGLLVQAM